MSAETDSFTDMDTIFIQLLHEGTFVMRPAKGRRISGNRYEIIATPDYDEDVETWEFTPGSTVDCIWEQHCGKWVLVAKKLTS